MGKILYYNNMSCRIYPLAGRFAQNATLEKLVTSSEKSTSTVPLSKQKPNSPTGNILTSFNTYGKL